MGFLIQFFFLTSMSLLSAISFDVAQSMRRLLKSGTSEYRLYLALSYCVPLAVTLLTLIAELALTRCSWAWPGTRFSALASFTFWARKRFPKLVRQKYGEQYCS